MMNDTVIRVENVSKKYCRELKHTMLYGIQDIAKNAIGLSSRSEKLRDGEFWALDNVSFKVKKGETLGIIGANGSGKTTLLKLLNGIFMPDKGKIEISGKVGALIEVGAGFHPMLTGRENIYVNGAILGMSKKEIDRKFDEIVDFADIGDFIDSPVKHYSSGMYVRLGFAVAVHCEPDILLIDEVLAVGDINFQIKCFRKIAEFQEKGKTIVFVTHDMGAIQRHTERVVLLNRGVAVCEDIPKKIISKYLSLVAEDFEETKTGQENLKTVSVDELERAAQKKFLQKNLKDDHCFQRKNYNSNEFRYGIGGARIIDFEVLDTQVKEIAYLKSGDPILFRVKVMFYSSVQKPVFGVIVKTKEGMEIFSSNTLYKDIEVRPQKKGDILCVEYRIVLNLPPGDYFLSAGVASINSGEVVPLDRRYDMVHLSVLHKDDSFEKANVETSIRLYYQ